MNNILCPIPKRKQFKSRPLPQLAQISSINKFIVEDFNSDGNLDVVLVGNLCNTEVETQRNDSSFGLYPKGDRNGNFDAETMMESGLKIVGDVRDMEVLSKNGEKYLLVAKNDAQLQLIKVN